MCKLVCYAFFFESSNDINLINIKYTLAKGDTQMWLLAYIFVCEKCLRNKEIIKQLSLQ